MADYRPLYCSFWTDPDMEPLNPYEKLVYAMLFTCAQTTESGIYSISPKYISERTNITIIKINEILNTLQNTYKKITYDNGVLFVHGFMRRNFKGNPEMLFRSIVKNFENNPSRVCWTKFLEVYKNHCICNKIKEKLDTLQSVGDTSIAMTLEMNMNLEQEEGLKGEGKTWRNNYETYEKMCSDAFDKLIADFDWIKERKEYHHGLNIRKSAEKMFFDFWGTKEGWKHKKASKTSEIDWRATINNGLSLKSNQVWIQKNEPDEELEFIKMMEIRNAKKK